jgi:hypothetical protein
MKKNVKNQTPPFDSFLKFKLAEKETGDAMTDDISPSRRRAAQDLSILERAADEALMERVAADLEGRETPAPSLGRGVTTWDELSDDDLLADLLLGVYETIHTCLRLHLMSVAVVFGVRYPDIKARLGRFTAFWGGQVTENPGWYNNLSNPVSLYLNPQGINLLAVAVDARSPYAYLRWRCADGSWAVVPLPAYFERLYRRGRP